jgi:endonuclease-3
MNPENQKELLRLLKKEYGAPKTELNYADSFQLLISVMLSAQSTDKKVNEITPALFENYPDPLTLSKARLSKVESFIRQVNYYKTKSRHLIETSKILVKNFSSTIPKTHEELISLPGVGNKTANVILSELGLDYAFPVDTHVFRVSRRLGLASSTSRDKVEKELCARFPKNRWQELHHWLIFHGRRVCVARTPKCNSCKLSELCPKINS